MARNFNENLQIFTNAFSFTIIKQKNFIKVNFCYNNFMKKIELLAPAQNIECAITAINSGADAVYIGANAFGARQNATNKIEDIEKIVNFAHLFNAKVYVALNTILNDEELLQCKKIIEKLYEIKVDAIIIQDFGILELSMENELPPIVLHGSTQCNIRNVEKVKFFEEIGLKRVILARELPLVEIEKINKNTNIELEHFISGALCVCYSGQCYLSEYIGNRSANKGQCGQACRKKYSLIDKNGKFIAKNKHLLSLKDNNLSKHLEKLINAGVVSFKIEGRLKDSNYVKNNVLYYHNLLKKYPRVALGRIVQDFEPNIEKTFNRGFCDDYLFNKKDNIYNFSTPKSIGEFIGVVLNSSDDSFVVKTNKEINPQDGLCFIVNEELSGCLVNRVEKVKSGLKIYPNKKLHLKLNEKVFRNIDVEFNKKLQNSATKRKLDVVFKIDKEKISIEDDFNNKEKLEIEFSEFANNKEKMKENFKKALSKTVDTEFFVKEVIFDCEEIPFLPVSKINEIRKNLIEKLKVKILSKYRTKKQKPVTIAEFPFKKGDYRLNCHNEKAKEFYEFCDCKVEEMSLEKTKDYKNKELMRTKHCLKRAFFNCNYQEELFLVDEKNVKYPLVFDCKNCEMVIKSPNQ